MPEDRKSKRSKSRSASKRKKERRERDYYGYDNYDEDPWQSTRRGVDGVVGAVVPAYVGILGLGLLGGALSDFNNRNSGGGGNGGGGNGGGNVGGTADIEPNMQYSEGNYDIEPRDGMYGMGDPGYDDMHGMGDMGYDDMNSMDGMGGMDGMDMSHGRMVGGSRRHRPAVAPGNLNVTFR